ncbi:hypothetical protein ACFQL4_26575 [Halosimplex aquaticum]
MTATTPAGTAHPGGAPADPAGRPPESRRPPIRNPTAEEPSLSAAADGTEPPGPVAMTDGGSEVAPASPRRSSPTGA